MRDKRKLLSAARRGDEQALRTLIDTYGPRLYQVALRILRHPEDAEDSLQEAFLTALRKLRQFDGRSNFFTWIYRITVNASLMALRKRRSRKRKEKFLGARGLDIRSHQLIDWSADPARSLLAYEMQEEIKEAIDKLPAKYRVVFVLRDLEGLTTAEAGRILGITAANVKVRLMRARIFLRETLKKKRR